MRFNSVSDFEKLEGRIKKLIEQNIRLKEQNKVLLEKLRQNEGDMKELRNEREKLNELRNAVCPRVIDLIERLEDIDIPD